MEIWTKVSLHRQVCSSQIQVSKSTKILYICYHAVYLCKDTFCLLQAEMSVCLLTGFAVAACSLECSAQPENFYKRNIIQILRAFSSWLVLPHTAANETCWIYDFLFSWCLWMSKECFPHFFALTFQGFLVHIHPQVPAKVNIWTFLPWQKLPNCRGLLNILVRNLGEFRSIWVWWCLGEWVVAILR